MTKELIGGESILVILSITQAHASNSLPATPYSLYTQKENPQNVDIAEYTISIDG